MNASDLPLVVVAGGTEVKVTPGVNLPVIVCLPDGGKTLKLSGPLSTWWSITKAITHYGQKCQNMPVRVNDQRPTGSSTVALNLMKIAQ